MKRQLKTFLTILSVIGIFMWHHQATLFQRHVRENVILLKDFFGSSVQLGDIVLSKYLFKVEFKKPQIDISSQSLENFRLAHINNKNPLLNFVLEKMKSYSSNSGFTYRLGDRLIVSYNPFWQDLTFTSVGDGEVSIYKGDEKISLIAPDHKDLNQEKIRISLPSPWWWQKVKRFFSKRKCDNFVRISSSYRNAQIIESISQEILFTHDFSTARFELGQESINEKNYYTLKFQGHIDNASFNPNLAKIWPIFEPFVLGGKLNEKQDFKISVQQEEFWHFIDTFFTKIKEEILDWKTLIKSIPSLYLEEKKQIDNQVYNLKNDYKVDYQPSKDFFKADINYSFQGYAEWDSYLEKILASYSHLMTTINKDLPSYSKEKVATWVHSLFSKLANKGEIKAGLMMELKDLNKEKIQAQSKLSLEGDGCGISVLGEYINPPVIKFTFEFENYEKLLNKIYSYGFSVLEGSGNKAGEIVLSGIKNYLIDEIGKLSIIKDEKTPHIRTLSIQFDTHTQVLEIANQPLNHQVIEIFKIVGVLASQTGLTENFIKLMHQ